MNRIKSAKKQTLDGTLFLRGVFKKDCKRIEDFFHERLLHDSAEEMKMFDKIPLVFCGLDTWPKSTNLLCWTCNRAVKGRPWFEPQSIDPLSRGQVGVFVAGKDLKKMSGLTSEYCINAKGNFCCANCVSRYIRTNSRDLAERLNKLEMLRFVHEIFTGRSVPDIHPSPPVSEMIQYGGTLTPQEYQKRIEDLAAQYMKQEDDNFISSCKMYVSRLIVDT